MLKLSKHNYVYIVGYKVFLHIPQKDSRVILLCVNTMRRAPILFTHCCYRCFPRTYYRNLKCKWASSRTKKCMNICMLRSICPFRALLIDRTRLLPLEFICITFYNRYMCLQCIFLVNTNTKSIKTEFFFKLENNELRTHVYGVPQSNLNQFRAIHYKGIYDPSARK